MNRKRLRLVLVEQGKRLVDLHRLADIPYNRLIRIVNGYCAPRPEEIDRLARALGMVAGDLMEGQETAASARP
jgi:predicted transcriptional regulator